MKNWLLILVVFGFVLSSCNDTIPIGTNILPGTDHPDNFYTDTTTVHSWTVREDSLRSDKLFTSLLGYMEDPIFGNTNASLLMGFRIPNTSVNPSLTDTLGGYYLDSIRLSLAITNIYGDTNLPMSFTIYKLPAPLNSDQVYYSNFSFPQGMVEIGRIDNYKPSLMREYDEDTTLTDLGPQMRIELNPFFGQSLLNILHTDQIKSNELFQQYLPGLVIIPDQMSGGSILQLDMLTNSISSSVRTALEDSRIHMYYKNTADSNLSVIFPATVLNLGINNFEHDYSSTNVESALGSISDEGDAVNYVQGLAGVKTKVTFPFIDAYGENTAVLKAELVVTQLDDGSEEIFTPASRLLALKIDENGLNENVTDFSTFPAGHFGGFSNLTTLSSGEEVVQYRINISDYIQRIMLGQEVNDGLYITLYGEQNVELTTLNSSELVPNRVVIGGGINTNDDYRLRLELTYTVLD